MSNWLAGLALVGALIAVIGCMTATRLLRKPGDKGGTSSRVPTRETIVVVKGK